MNWLIYVLAAEFPHPSFTYMANSFMNESFKTLHTLINISYNYYTLAIIMFRYDLYRYWNKFTAATTEVELNNVLIKEEGIAKSIW